ncbi:MAG: MGH1-like glycoside hydrolase domain-containing protein [Kiritimatiellia bacterium]
MRMQTAWLCWTLGAVAACAAAAGDPYDHKKTVQRRVAPVAIRTNAVGRVLVDFGREAFGFLEFVPPAGTRGRYHVRLGELLRPDGSVNMAPGATIRAEKVEREIRADGVHRVPLAPNPRNTTGGREGGAVPIPPEHGVVLPFRYAEVFAAPFPVTAETVRMVAVNYPIDMAASAFACSDARLVRVYDFCKYSILATSFAGLYVDGDRERIPYEADAYLNQLGEYAVHADYSLGRTSHEYLMRHPTWPTEWKQHSIKMAWADWMWSGDTRSLAKFYDRLKDEKLLLQFVRESDGLLLTGGERSPGRLCNARGAADIVDWPPGERDGFVFRDVNAVVNAFFYRNLLEMADIARALGKAADAARFQAQARQVHAAYQQAFFDPARRVYVDGEGTDHASLHANAAALAFGLVPAGQRRSVARHCLSRGMACSVYFSQYLLEAFYEAGEPDAALELMTATGDRTWLGMLEQGATVTMEAWSVKYKPNLDLNHAWGTPPLNVISRYVLGVTPLESGCAKVRIRPQIGRLAWVRGTVPTAQGAVEVAVADGVLDVVTPVPARVEFGGQVRDVPAGRCRIGAK